MLEPECRSAFQWTSDSRWNCEEGKERSEGELRRLEGGGGEPRCAPPPNPNTWPDSNEAREGQDN